MKRKNAGMITVDFLFALVLVMGFSAVLFALSLTLTVAEITQYITFASARTYMAANFDKLTQEQSAKQKYANLQGHPVLKNLYKGSWFFINEPDGAFVGNIAERVPTYDFDGERSQFWGVATIFVAKVLGFQIPFYGQTFAGDDEKGKVSFQTMIGSYLGREQTEKECLDFNNQRWKQIRNLPATGGMAAYSTNTSDNGYMSYDDNGC
jgi:hypothetical protein